MLADWQQHSDDSRKERIRKLGILTGLRRRNEAEFGPANFERALVLQRAMALLRPRRVLELGTGRGLGAIAMAEAARENGLATEITSVDVVPPTARRPWPIEVDGVARDEPASLDEIWSRHIEADLRQRILLRTGTNTAVLPALAAEKRKFDFIFIDAGRALFSVIHDLAYATELLSENGAILMNNFAPMEQFGLGTCIALIHARRCFAHLEVFPTEGLVYGGAAHPEAPRGMVFLKDRSAKRPRVIRRRLLWWRIAGRLLDLCYLARLYPIAT